ncbi:formate dehydrogenase family accessory protein FdhD [Methanofervidicoccus sp. A16]|uniref:formate dehydrogenase accessory sulfurtransferase FdhD n=1 Tax=Methanofervidicoccus sp. A16 TaxID=2607662 RepID=UPI00118D55A6|nr:formate dehydrogenase accessory sulfurtransferase FdhD [Methanofervidicoccus sp. A16]AXI25575.1 formate dehydrogenase family accessory protein FdhD [Methanofervidicoccus sp. A16]
MIKKLDVLIWRGSPEITEDYLCVERDYNIYINEKKIAEGISASPEYLRELGVGYTVSQGYLKEKDVKNAYVEDNKIVVEGQIDRENDNNRVVKEIKLPLSTILKVMKDMLKDKKTWELTGGTHWASIYTLEGERILSIEDIGRHNAVDKVIGYCVLRGIDLRDKILVSSGRQTYMMVNKGVNAGIPVIISKSPPMDRGVELARRSNLILIGFARGDRFTVYSGYDRILFKE